MENAAEALKMAFGYLMFVLALTMSISSFSQARETIDAIITMKDRETEYTYVEAKEQKIVGVETIFPTMYKAYKEDFKIIFYKYTDDTQTTTEPLYLYNSIDKYTNAKTPINYIDLEQEVFANAEEAINHLSILLDKRPASITDQYYNQFIYSNGLYDEFKDKEFEEILGEYYLEDSKAGSETNTIEANKTKKRVITYILLP